MTHPDFTIEELLAFARSKPADERYNFCDARNCAIAQFGIETGRPELVGVGDAETFGEALYEAVNDDLGEWTFGKLAVRLEALLPAKPVSDTWTKRDAYGSIEQLAREVL